MITPYTPKEVIARIYNSPALAFDKTSSALNGTTAQAASAGISTMIGAITKRNLFEPEGTIISFMNSFKPSANGCNRPK
jgi:hypothetical protein